MRDLRVKLHAVILARAVLHRSKRRIRAFANHLEPVRQRLDAIAVAHPDLEHRLLVLGVAQAGEQFRVERRDFGVAEFPVRRRLDLAAELRGHCLHAVTDSQDGYFQFEHGLCHLRRIVDVHRFGTAGQNNS